MKKIIIIVVVIIIVAAAAVQLKTNRDKNTTLNMDLTEKVVTVSVANVIEKNASMELNLTGTLKPYKELNIPSEISGKITKLNFNLGSTFSKGSVIATIDDKLKKLTYLTAKSDFEKIAKDLQRTKNLYEGGSASEQTLDAMNASYETAKNKMEDAEKQLSYTNITTSIAGTITKKNIEEGTYVNQGTIVATIVDISRLKVNLSVSETNVYLLKKGQKVNITTDIYPNITFSGIISFISPSGNDYHNYDVEVEMANSAKNPLKAGSFVNVSIKISSDRNGLFIPREALIGSVKDAQVYIAKNGKAVLQKITVENTNDNYLLVLSGLTKDEQVVIAGQVNLSNNKSIKIINN